MHAITREELKVIFSMGEIVELDEIHINGSTLRFERRKEPFEPVFALRLIISIMKELSIPESFSESGKLITTKKLLKKVERSGKWRDLKAGDLSFEWAVVGACEFCFLSIQEEVAGAAGDWDKWVEAFLHIEAFVQAWVFDVDYDYWQNAKDPLQYRAAGRDYSRLPMRMNDLPSPLDRMEIDTSRNPGRWILKRGYVEAVGAVMWLSDLFWGRVGSDHKQRLAQANWLKVVEPISHVVKIQASEICFHDESTAHAQDKLRELIYL